ncbi:MAG: asparagine synthase (glutamine-hydrolyzing) [Candidatus Aminicenantes bacterium]|nr:asparagine synthase (glutamine-hydrolyzing) [Candidatus Aminicenantes bacterium]
MCGLCGLFRPSGLRPEDRETVLRMTQTLIHRGPDEDGFYDDDLLSLGMRRLKIIDLVTGRQPIANEDKSIWTVYNGEIFNFLDLRSELEKRGHLFKTKSDTEVIVHLYEEEGIDFVHRLNGMFAIALWDKRNKRLCLYRDRLGIKPLHYSLLPDGLIFASEIKALLAAGIDREIDLEALSQFFSFEFIPAPRTIFKKIKKLLPGHRLIYQGEALKIEKYWDVTFEPDDPPRAINEYSEEILVRLREAVRKRLISDVPLGVFLSGGLDSSTVTALMKEVDTSPIKTFSIGFREKSFNELHYARLVANFLQTDHQEFVVEPQLVTELVPKLMNYLDEPLADASVIPTFLISYLARKQVTVALAGDGGDELFAGYDTYKAYRLATYYRKLPRFLNWPIKSLVNLLPASNQRLSFEFKAKKFLLGIDYPPEIANYIWWGAYPPQEKIKLFSPQFRENIKKNPYEPIAWHLRNCQAKDPLDRIFYLDLKLYLQDDLLVKVDRMSMANSLEIRVPFLDYTFVEFAARIPNHLKLKGFESKYILKKAMAGRLPPEIFKRPKIGFDIPLGAWISRDLKSFVLDILSPQNLSRHGFFNQWYIEQKLKEHLRGQHNHRQLLWPIIIFQFWYDRYYR